MNIKKTLLTFTVLVIGTFSVYAACPAWGGSYASKQQEYLCKRYVTFNHAGVLKRLDMSQVQQVFIDTHGHAQHSLSPKPPWAANSLHVYVVFNNSGWILFGLTNTTPSAIAAWDAYRDFLIENPSFIGMR